MKNPTSRPTTRRRQAAGRTRRLLTVIPALAGLLTTPWAAAEPPAGSINTGLWIGDVVLRSVTHARTGEVDPAPSQAQLRLLLHVDATGKVRLLKEVIVAQPDLTAPAGTELLIFSDVARTTGRPIATDASRGGAARAQRIAAAAYDFKDTDGTDDHALDLSGSLAGGQSLTGTLLLDPQHPTNPFRHKYHSDHANEGAGAFEISRDLRIEFAGDPQTVNGSPRIQGNYSETIHGLHRADLVVQGTVLLTRISPVAALNP